MRLCEEHGLFFCKPCEKPNKGFDWYGRRAMEQEATALDRLCDSLRMPPSLREEFADALSEYVDSRADRKVMDHESNNDHTRDRNE